jgi:hypothetical protein
MPETTVAGLAARLEALERENRRLRRWAALALASLAALAGVGAARETTPRIVEARQFVVRDDAGRIRARLGIASPEGAARLTLQDADGRVTADVGGTTLYPLR